MEFVVPHKFYTGDRLDPKKLNENALVLYEAMQKVLAQRYSHFQFILDLGAYASTDAAGEAQRSVQAPFAYEIIDSQIFVHDVSSQTLTLECSDSAWNDLSVEVSTNADPGYSQNSQVQNVKVAANTKVDFTMTVPSSDVDQVWAIIKCRYDAFNGVTIPAPPQVAAGETVSATEWNTWFTNVQTFINTHAEGKWPKRKSFEVHSFRNLTGTSIGTYGTPTSSVPTMLFNGGTRELLDVSFGYFSSNVGSTTSLGISIWDYGNNQVMCNNAISAVGTSGTPQFDATATVSNSTLINDPDDDDLGVIPYTGSLKPTLLETLYTVLYWEQ